MQNDFPWPWLLTPGQRAWKTSTCLYRECNLSSRPQFWLIFLTYHDITPCNIRRFINVCLLSLWYSVTAVRSLVFQGHSSLCNLPPFSLSDFGTLAALYKDSCGHTGCTRIISSSEIFNWIIPTKSFLWWDKVTFAYVCAQSRPALSSPTDSSVGGISQARVLEWTAIPSSRGSSQARGRNCVSYVSCIGTTTGPPGK